ncbi:MAG: quinol:electron acceptor oxidoreductase subunit ActD, partial [bacterium]
LKKERFLRVSDDRFIIAVEAKDAKFDPEQTKQLLLHAGATRVETVSDE